LANDFILLFLQGFWDMIAFQVDDVKKLFADLTAMESNDWKVEENRAPDSAGAPRKTKKTTVFKRAAGKKESAAASKSRQALRQMMAAGRREVAASSAATATLAPEKAESSSSSSRRTSVLLDPRTPNSVLRPVNRAMEKVFEGGFFAVRSPSRGPGEWLDFPADGGQDENA
jgi:disks large-associated protein 5